MITAIIAGAIVGLFNPNNGVSLSPLATAFLVGYGVELFFRFLDTMINFGATPRVGPGRPGS
jgi:Na+/H+-dicarboxylate symporter